MRMTNPTAPFKFMGGALMMHLLLMGKGISLMVIES